MNKYINFIKDQKNQRKYLKWLLDITSSSRKSLFGLFLLYSCTVVASVLVSLVNKSIVDRAGDKVVFRTLVVILVSLYIISIFGGLIESMLESIVVEKYACQVRKDMFEKFLKIPWISRSAYHSEELLSRITSDVERITSGMSGLIISGGALLIRLCLAFCILWNYSTILAVTLIIIAPVGAITSMLIGRKLGKLQREYQQTEADYRIFLQERLSKIELVQIFGKEKDSIEQLQKIQDKRLILLKKKTRWRVLGGGVIGMTFSGAQLIAFVAGALMVNNGSITFGMMTAFLSLVGQIQGPVYSLAKMIPQIIGILASAGRIMEISELKSEDNTPEGKFQNDGEPLLLGMRADNVSIGYDSESSECIVKNISFDIQPGQMVMLAGRSGIGKTTLLRAVMGFLSPASGKLYFYSDDGTQADCSPKTRRMISYVPQGNTLMFGTIADNLRMGKSDASEEQMKKALRMADALDFVEGLPEGINTEIGEKAAGISEGQAQRISIARALLKESAILILDEATSALDEKTELKILDAISKSKHQTCLFVSHRRYLERYAEQVLELQ